MCVTGIGCDGRVEQENRRRLAGIACSAARGAAQGHSPRARRGARARRDSGSVAAKL